MTRTISRRSLVAGLAVAGVAVPLGVRSAFAAGDLETGNQKIKVEWDKPWKLNLVDSGPASAKPKNADGSSADKVKYDVVILQDGKGSYLEVFAMPMLAEGQTLKMNFMMSGLEPIEEGGEEGYTYSIDKGQFGSKPYGRFVKSTPSADGKSMVLVALTAPVDKFEEHMADTIETSKVDGHPMFENVDPAALAAVLGASAPDASPAASPAS